MAGRIEGITVEIGGDAAGLQKEIKKINSSLQATTRELKGVDSLLRLDPGNVDLLRQKEELLNKSLEEQEAKLKQLKTSKKNLDQSMANGTEVNQKEYRNLVREIAATENKVNQLKKSSEEFGSVAKQIKLQGLETAKADFNKLTQSIEKTKSELKDIDSLLRLDPGNVDLLRQKEELLNKSLAEQEQKLNSLKNAQNQLGKTEIGNKQYQKLTREISSAENEVKSLKAQIKSFGSVGKQQAKAVGKSFEEAGDKIKNVGSKFKTATAGIAAGAIGVVEGTKELNRDLSRLEINAETAGVSVNFLEDQLAGAVAVTGETDSSVEALSNLLAAGFDATNFQEALEGLEGAALKFSDTLKLEGLADGLQETLATGAAVGPFAELLERSGISLDEFNKGLVAAKENGEETNYALQTLADLGLADVYNKWAENNEALSNYEENLFNLQTALVDLANVIMPLLTPIIETITEVIKKFTALPENVQTGIASFVGIIAVLAPVISVIGKISTGIGQLLIEFAPQFASLAKGFVSLFGSLKAVLPALKGLGGAIVSAMTGPVGIAIAAVAALTVAFVVLWKKCESFRNFFIETFEEIKAIVAPALQEIGASFSAFWTDSLLPALLAIKEALMPLIASIATSFVEYFQQIMPTIQVVLQAIVPLIQSAISLILSLLGTIVPIVQSVITTLLPIVQAGVNAIVPILQSVISVLQGIIDFLTGVFTGDWALAWSGIKQVFSGVINTISALFRAWANVAKAVVTAVKGVFEAAGKRIKSLFQAVGSAISAALTAAAATVKAVWSSVTGFFSNLWSTIKSLATSAANGIKNVWNSVVAFIRTIPGKIVAVFSSLPGRMVAVGRNIIDGIIRGVMGAAQNLLAQLRSLGGKVLSTITSYFRIKSPSRVMQEVVGKNIVLGISSGIYKYADNATDAMKETSQNILSEAEKILDIQESLGELTAEQELAYWKEVKKLTGIQGEELLQIDKKIAEAEKKILDEQQKAQEEQLKEYENRVDKLAGFANIFSEVKFETVSGDKLTENLQDQVYALEEYAEIMQKLTEKGISSGLLAELQEQGVGAIDELRALARMSDDELLRYDSLYTQKMQLAAEQAAKELGQASTNIVNSVAEAVDTLNTNATIAVQNGQDNQTAMLSNISTEVANIVGQSLAGGLAGIANLIVSAMPEILRLNMDSQKVAETSWGAFGELANTRGRIFAPSESQIRDIAMNVINSVLAGKPTTT